MNKEMAIYLRCPNCSAYLTDKFDSPEVSLLVGVAYRLEMECLKCSKYMTIEVTPYMTSKEEEDT